MGTPANVPSVEGVRLIQVSLYTHCLQFLLEDYNTQEKLKTKVMQNLGDKQGVLHKRYANGKCCFRKAESIFTLLLNKKPHSYS